MGKNTIDCRPTENRITKLVLSEIEFIETTGKDSDYKIGMQNGTIYIFRCSCCLCPDYSKNELAIG